MSLPKGTGFGRLGAGPTVSGCR